MRTIQLGEVARIRNGFAFPSEAFRQSGVPVIRMSDLQDAEVNPKSAARVDASFFRDLPEFRIQRGDLLIGMSGSVGKIAPYLASEPALQNQRVGVFRVCDDSALDFDYLRFFAVTLEAKLSGLGKGVAVKNVSADDIESLLIPLPILSDQKRIAGELEEANRLRRMCRYSLELSDTFVPSVFIEMFGDPMMNPKGWDREKFADLGKLDRGKSKHRPRNAPDLYGGQYPFIQTGDIANCANYIKQHHQTYSEEGLKQSKLWPAETLCITIAANIAKTGILTYPACFPDSVVGFLPNENVTTEFVQYWLGFLQIVLERTAPESAQKNINLEILRELPVPVPPLRLQKQFSDLVRRFEQLRTKEREAERQANHLFQTLLHRAFASQR